MSRADRLVMLFNDIMVWDGSFTFQVRGPASGPDGSSYRGLDGPARERATTPLRPRRLRNELADPKQRSRYPRQQRAAKARTARRSRQYISSRGAGSVVVDVIPDAGRRRRRSGSPAR